MGTRCKYDIYHSSGDRGRRGGSKVLCAEMRAAHVFWICVTINYYYCWGSAGVSTCFCYIGIKNLLDYFFSQEFRYMFLWLANTACFGGIFVGVCVLREGGIVESIL